MPVISRRHQQSVWYRVPVARAGADVRAAHGRASRATPESRISYEGIRQCYEQGGELLGLGYSSQVVRSTTRMNFSRRPKLPEERQQRFADVLGAYRALFESEAAGAVQAVGIGSKTGASSARSHAQVDPDWVMFAQSHGSIRIRRSCWNSSRICIPGRGHDQLWPWFHAGSDRWRVV